MQKVLTIEGMMCAHCAHRVEMALKSVDGIDYVTVDLEAKTASIRGDEISDEVLSTTILEAGYEVISIQ